MVMSRMKKKAKAANVLLSSKKTPTPKSTELRANRVERQEQIVDKGRSISSRRLRTRLPSTDRATSTAEDKIKSPKPSGGVEKAASKGGARKPTQGRSKPNDSTTPVSTPKRRRGETEDVELATTLSSKDELLPVLPDVAVA